MTAGAPTDARRHQPFRFRNTESLLAAAQRMRLDLPFKDRLTPLFTPLALGPFIAPNRLVVQPMEGCDSDADGAPTELTFERYERYARGGNGLIWFEATSISPDGRSNPRQLMLTSRTVEAFAHLARATRLAAAEALGPAHRPLLVLQITHSGRFSFLAPGDVRRVACANPRIDTPGEPTSAWSDAELDALVERFVRAALLAREAGFDIVDVKACHGYLLHELLGAHQREGSRYGGSFENRARFLLEVTQAAASHGVAVGVRLNATDGLPFPYGFGTAADGSGRLDLSETHMVAERLDEAGCVLLNVTAGIPARLPHIGRPFDRPTKGSPTPPEHPLTGVCRLIDLARQVQQQRPRLPVVGTGYSWLRQFWPGVGAAVVDRGWASMIGVGRGAFAYPDAPLDLVRYGRLDPGKCCVSCSYCTELMRARVPTGCVVRNRSVYRPPVASTPATGVR